MRCLARYKEIVRQAEKIILLGKKCGPKKDLVRLIDICHNSLTAESVQGAALTLQSVNHIHSGHSLPLGVLGVGDSITDHVLKENFENTTSFLVDQARNTLDTTTASETTNGRLGDTLDVITQHLPVTLSATLSQTLSSFTASRHCYSFVHSVYSDTATLQLRFIYKLRDRNREFSAAHLPAFSLVRLFTLCAVPRR